MREICLDEERCVIRTVSVRTTDTCERVRYNSMHDTNVRERRELETCGRYSREEDTEQKVRERCVRVCAREKCTTLSPCILQQAANSLQTKRLWRYAEIEERRFARVPEARYPHALLAVRIVWP